MRMPGLAERGARDANFVVWLDGSLYEFGKGNPMAQDIESESTQLFQFDPVAVSKPKRPSIGLKVLQGVVAICSFAVVVAMFSAGVFWMVNRTPKPNGSADRFLWFAGQNKTWDQYQQEQKAAGRGRLDEKEYDWTQQLLNDAYSNRR